jgi:hypothetical protein
VLDPFKRLLDDGYLYENPRVLSHAEMAFRIK